MALPEINTKLAIFALEKCEGFPFESFANDFLAALEGKTLGSLLASPSNLINQAENEKFYRLVSCFFVI